MTYDCNMISLMITYYLPHRNGLAYDLAHIHGIQLRSYGIFIMEIKSHHYGLALVYDLKFLYVISHDNIFTSYGISAL